MAVPQIRRVLWDTTVYINYFSKGILPTHMARGHLFLSSVVMQELYAGAQSKDASRKLDLLFDTMSSYDRLVTPTATDWKQAGKILSGIGRRFGFEEIGRSRMTNDVLIAISCVRANASLCTGNAKDFQRILEFINFSFTIV